MSSRENFYRKNGYYASEEDALRLTRDARKWIRRCNEIFDSLSEEFLRTNGCYPEGEDFMRLKKEAEAEFTREENEKNQNRTVEEIYNAMIEDFYDWQGFYPVETEHIRLDAVKLKKRAEAARLNEEKGKM